MFTGLVETTGRLRARDRRGPGYTLRIDAELGPLELGESIAVNGACLTVTEHDGHGFSADVSAETVDRTTLGRVALGQDLNLERSLRLGDRLGGHLVSGHVDGVARLLEQQRVGEAWKNRFQIAAELTAFVAPKGSITLDGVSLTVNAVADTSFEVMLIPHTVAVTNLKALRPGREVNVEVDLLARYVVHYLGSGERPAAGTAQTDPGLLSALLAGGFGGPGRA